MDTDNKYLQDALLMGKTRDIVDTALGMRTVQEKCQADAKSRDELFNKIRTKALVELVNAKIGKDFANRLQVYSPPRRKEYILDDEYDHVVFTTREPGGLDVYVHFRVRHFYDQNEMSVDWYWNGTHNPPITTNGWYNYNPDFEPLANLYLATLEGIEIYHGKPQNRKDTEPEQAQPKPAPTPGERLIDALIAFIQAETGA